MLERRGVRTALRWLAALYLAGLWLEGAGSTLPETVLPRPVSFFLQVAALFPHAATAAIDYRAEGWVCADGAWREMDTRAYFPIDADNKENRFDRVMHFFRENRPAMRALDAYLVEGHAAGRRGSDGIPLDRAIGGVRLSSLRVPIPAPGDPIEPFQRRPLAEYPDDQRHVFYHTPRSVINERCGGSRP
jgi:hypothetical protein